MSILLPQSSEFCDYNLESLQQAHLGPAALTDLSLPLRPPPLCSCLIEGRTDSLPVPSGGWGLTYLCSPPPALTNFAYILS